MPNRILRDITDSEKVNVLSWQAEVIFYRLMMKADDYGVFHAKPSLIKAALFPLRLDSIRETDISRWIAECEKAGLIAFYESESKPYLVIINFGQRMRNMRKRFPSPPDNIYKVAASCGELRPEVEKETKHEVEVEEKSNAPNGFYEKENEKLLSIDHCAEVAMKDSTWVINSKADPEKIEAFKKSLRGQGVTEKSLKDFKKHFFFWSEKQKSNGNNNQRGISAAGNRSVVTENGDFGKL